MTPKGATVPSPEHYRDLSPTGAFVVIVVFIGLWLLLFIPLAIRLARKIGIKATLSIFTRDLLPSWPRRRYGSQQETGTDDGQDDAGAEGSCAQPGDQGWFPPRESKLVPESDLSPAAWIEPLLFEDWSEVRSMVPQGFEAYARAFFPFPGGDIYEDGEIIGQKHLTWREMARRSGRVAHALMEAETIQAPEKKRAYPGDELAEEQLAALLPILARHTSSPYSWFLLWDGFGDLDQQAFRPLPKVRHSIRNYYLLSGPHTAYTDLPHDPNYWWPDDQAWCVYTDTDLNWAYIAGSADCIREVLSVPVLDAYATKPEDPAHAGTDVINDPGGTIPRPI